MRIMVTGAGGFIGSWLVPELKTDGHEVIPLDLEDGDLSNPGIFDALAEKYTPGIVVHLAARVGRLYGEADLVDTITQNATATTLVARGCSQAGIRLVYTSSSEIYGDQADKLCLEDGPMVLPHNLYGLSKRWGEEACQLYAPRELLVLRISMPYGPLLHLKRTPQYRAAVINFLWQAYHRQPITVHRGSKRSVCWIGDTVRAIRMLIDQGHSGIWNVGRDDDELSMREIAEIACKLTDAPTDLIAEVSPPASQTIVKRLSMAKLYRIGWKPEVSLQDGMRRTLEWVRTLPGP